jgi:hypothetical protein
VVIVALNLESFVIGEIQRVEKNDETVYFETPGEFKLHMTPQGPATAIVPLGLFLDEIIDFIDFAPCQYLYAGKVSAQVAEAYDDFKKKLTTAKTGLVVPSASEAKAINKTIKDPKIIQFPK